MAGLTPKHSETSIYQAPGLDATFLSSGELQLRKYRPGRNFRGAFPRARLRLYEQSGTLWVRVVIGVPVFDLLLWLLSSVALLGFVGMIILTTHRLDFVAGGALLIVVLHTGFQAYVYARGKRAIWEVLRRYFISATMAA